MELDLLIRLLEKLCPVWNAACHETNVNEVKVINWICPFLRNIVNFKMAVRGHELGLNGREVDSDHLRRWVSVGKFTTIVRLVLPVVSRTHTLPRYLFRIPHQELSVTALENMVTMSLYCGPT